jgi:general secretion pathway protein K
MKLFRSQKGVALLMAIFCVMIMAFLAVEITYDTSVEYVISSKEYGGIKAYEAARAGVELSLLRIQLYKNVLNSLGDQLKGQEALTQMIWSFPFVWPPSVPANASMADKDQIKSTINDSFMDANYQTSISSEGSKIDINDLDSPSEALRKAIRDQLIQIFKTRSESDEAWREKYDDRYIEELVNNLQDWVDEDKVSLNGGDEESKYPNKQPEQEIPPNRPFQTMDEIRAVAGMNEELFQFLLPQVTIYGVKGININQANKELLKSIDPIITDKVADEVIERRSNLEKGGPFRDDTDFIGFIGANENRFNPSQIPLYYGNEYNFRIHSVGIYNNVQREIIAIVYDVEGVKERLKTILDKEADAKKDETTQQPTPNPSNPTAQPGQDQGQPAGHQQKPPLSTTKPRIVYWYEN